VKSGRFLTYLIFPIVIPLTISPTQGQHGSDVVLFLPDPSNFSLAWTTERLPLSISPKPIGSPWADVALEPADYDRNYSLNVFPFFPEMEAGFRNMYGALVPHSMVATTYQPRTKTPTKEKALELASRVETAMKLVGFVEIQRHELAIEPVPAICIIGHKR